MLLYIYTHLHTQHIHIHICVHTHNTYIYVSATIQKKFWKESYQTVSLWGKNSTMLCMGNETGERVRRLSLFTLYMFYNKHIALII